MCFLPALSIEKSPEEELSRPSVQPVEMVPGNAQRDHAGPLLRHLGYTQAMPEITHDRLAKAEKHDEFQRGDEKGCPECRCHWTGDELLSGGYLVEPGQHHSTVCHEMNREPGMVSESSTDGDNRRNNHQE